LLQHAVNTEVAEYVEEHAGDVGADGRRQVVRNGWMKEREVMTGAGPIGVRRPRVHDKRCGERFTSKILPPYSDRRERTVLTNPEGSHRSYVGVNARSSRRSRLINRRRPQPPEDQEPISQSSPTAPHVRGHG